MTGFFRWLAFTLVASSVYWTGQGSLRGTDTKKEGNKKVRGLKKKKENPTFVNCEDETRPDEKNSVV